MSQSKKIDDYDRLPHYHESDEGFFKLGEGEFKKSKRCTMSESKIIQVMLQELEESRRYIDSVNDDYRARAPLPVRHVTILRDGATARYEARLRNA